jgi:hypothetical protein
MSSQFISIDVLALAAVVGGVDPLIACLVRAEATKHPRDVLRPGFAERVNQKRDRCFAEFPDTTHARPDQAGG